MARSSFISYPSARRADVIDNYFGTTVADPYRWMEEQDDNPDLQAFKKRILGGDYFVLDQWQLEELAKVMERCKVKVVSHGLPPETLRTCHAEPAASVEQAVADSLAEYGPSARVAVIPKGPYVLPYVA